MGPMPLDGEIVYENLLANSLFFFSPSVCLNVCVHYVMRCAYVLCMRCVCNLTQHTSHTQRKRTHTHSNMHTWRKTKLFAGRCGYNMFVCVCLCVFVCVCVCVCVCALCMCDYKLDWVVYF